MTKAVLDDVQLLIPVSPNRNGRPDRVRFVFLLEGQRQVLDVDVESARDGARWLAKILNAEDSQPQNDEPIR